MSNSVLSILVVDSEREMLATYERLRRTLSRITRRQLLTTRRRDACLARVVLSSGKVASRRRGT